MKTTKFMKEAIKLAVVFFALMIITCFLKGGISVILFITSFTGFIFMCVTLFILWVTKNLFGEDFFGD